MSLHVQIQSFEGPLPLLIHLIKSEDMDIFNINIHEITKQYLDHIKAMRQLDLEVAGEFLVMAATLVHIKSRMLLPQYDEEGEDSDEDPRAELMQRLWEYQKFQEASKNLYQRPLVGRDLWLRGTKTTLPVPEGDIDFEGENSLFHLISYYRRAIKNMKNSVHKIEGELLSIGDRILEIKDQILVGRQISLNQLIDSKNNRVNQALITFLSLLELAKMGFVSLFQSHNFGDIYIHTHRIIDPHMMDRIEEDTMAKVWDDEERERKASLLNPSLWDDTDDKEKTHERDNPLIKAATDEEILHEESLLDLESGP